MPKGAKVRCAALVEHDWGTAHQIIDIRSILVEMFLEQILVDESRGVLPIAGPCVR